MRLDSDLQVQLTNLNILDAAAVSNLDTAQTIGPIKTLGIMSRHNSARQRINLHFHSSLHLSVACLELEHKYCIVNVQVKYFGTLTTCTIFHHLTMLLYDL